jgi:hypothetical protein
VHAREQRVDKDARGAPVAVGKGVQLEKVRRKPCGVPHDAEEYILPQVRNAGMPRLQ